MAPDEDWYFIWLELDKSIIIEMDFLNSDGNLDLELYNSSNSLLIGSYTTNDYESISYSVKQTDNYYIRVYNQPNPSYHLDIKIDDKFEPNDDFSNALAFIF